MRIESAGVATEQARKDTLGQSDRIKAAVAQFEESGTMLKKRETEVAVLEDQLAAARSDSKANKEYSDQVYQVRSPPHLLQVLQPLFRLAPTWTFTSCLMP